MKLKVVGSGSSGNCYCLVGDKEILVIECGIQFKEVKKHIDFDVDKIVGVITTHSHGDHSEFAVQYENAGIPVFKPFEETEKRKFIQFGEFKIDTFPLHHDVPCYGFLISHPEMGRMVYASDTSFIRYTFKDINHFLVEANYDDDEMQVEEILANHIYRGHMSINTAIEFLRTNFNKNTKTICLCHLSQKNADAMKFIDKVVDEFDRVCYIARKGVSINL